MRAVRGDVSEPDRGADHDWHVRRRLRAPDYPWAPTLEKREAFCQEIFESWGGPVGIEDRAPSMAADPAFRDWWATYLRMGASPSAAVALTRMNSEIDIRPRAPDHPCPIAGAPSDW